MRADKHYCFICLKQKDLSLFKITEKKIYKEFAGYGVPKTEKFYICTDCRDNLINSLNFLKLCKKTNLRLQKKFDLDECDRVIDEITITVNDDNFHNEDLLIEPDGEILEVIELENVEIQAEICQQKFKCATCDAEFTKKQQLKIHCLKHSGIREWKCEFEGCEKDFATEIRLRNHTRTHTKEKPFACDWKDCDMRFAQQNALLCHKRIHLNEKPYTCQVCGKKFTQNTTLKTHVAAKHAGNPVECDYPGCNRKFPRNSFLILHKKRDHENIRNYNCEECGKKYKQKSHLDRHVEASHKNIRHQCQYCEKSFSKSWSLKLHLFKHTEACNFPYKCTACEMSFQRRDMWNKHMSKVHPGVVVKRDAIEITVTKEMINKEKS